MNTKYEYIPPVPSPPVPSHRLILEFTSDEMQRFKTLITDVINSETFNTYNKERELLREIRKEALKA